MKTTGVLSEALAAVNAGLGHPDQAGSIELPRSVERHLVQREDLLGRLVTDLRATEPDQLLAGRAIRSRVEHDVGAHVLAMDGVVDAYDAGALDARVPDQHLLDLLRADVRTVVDEDLLLAAAEVEVVVLVALHHVAGVEPAIAKDLRRRG